jgi:hypothetical protein
VAHRWMLAGFRCDQPHVRRAVGCRNLQVTVCTGGGLRSASSIRVEPILWLRSFLLLYYNSLNICHC